MTTAREELGPVSPRAHVAIVDDHRLLVDAVALALEDQGHRVTVPELGSREVLAEDLLAARPDLVLLDLDLGGELGDGSTLVRPLVEAGLRVLIVSATSDVEQTARAVECGAVGLVAKSRPFAELVRTVVAAAVGAEVLAPRERLELLDAARRQCEARASALAPFERLSSRESEVLRAVTEGLTVATIARRSVVSEATVRAQVRSILTKLDVRSQLEAVVAAQRSGWS